MAKVNRETLLSIQSEIEKLQAALDQFIPKFYGDLPWDIATDKEPDDVIDNIDMARRLLNDPIAYLIDAIEAIEKENR